MVVNLRGRSGVDPWLFGNGITHVIAASPSTGSSSSNNDDAGDNKTPAYSQEQIFADNLCANAKSIRQALQGGLLEIPEALLASQMGRPLPPSTASATESFSTTSWTQFPLYDIRFAKHRLTGFHGHPAHPLPEGRTFASVVTPGPDGTCCYEMLLPSDQAQQARARHNDMKVWSMKWKEPRNIGPHRSVP